MRALLVLALAALQAPSAPPSAPRPAPRSVGSAPSADVVAPPAAEDAPRVEPWPGRYADGLRAVRAHAEAGELAQALAVADQLAAPVALARWIEAQQARGGWRARAGRLVERGGDLLDLLGPPPAVRAEAHHARAMALGLGAAAATEPDLARGLRALAAQSCQRALVLAGPGALRGEAAYEAARFALLEAEALRARIPEISGQPAQPPLPPAAPAPGAPAAQPPDPLQLARAAYLAARERTIERLRLDWRDADAQAHAELIQRRLRELDAIEKQREQEQQQQEQEQDEQEQKDPQSDPSESQDPEKQDPKPPEDPPPDEKQEPEKPEESQPDDQDAEQPPQPQEDPKEAQPMSREEMMQLLEKLQRIEEIQRDLQERLKKMRRVAVKKDW